MNKVAKHFGFFMRTIGMAATASGGRTKAIALAELEQEYPPSAGWEITGQSFVAQNPEGFTFGVWLTQYELVEPVVVSAKSK